MGVGRCHGDDRLLIAERLDAYPSRTIPRERLVRRAGQLREPAQRLQLCE
jgi:hypothetical protein